MAAHQVTVEDIQSQLQREDFGFGRWMGIRVTALETNAACCELSVRDDMKRPPGTVAGPILMGLADATMWAVAIAVNEQGNQSVTSDITTHFLKRPDAAKLHCRATAIKNGRTLIVIRAEITCDDDPTVVCICQGTYAVPPKKILAD